MIDIVIFGTGSNGERAWRASEGRADVRVVCFADNDPRKHGTEFHGCPVVAAEALSHTAWDLIVIASMYARDISRQLIAMGLPEDAIVAPEPNRLFETLQSLAARRHSRTRIVLEDGEPIASHELPEILILTYETLNGSHGTGVLLQRFFADFPHDKLFSVCHTATGQPWLADALVLPGTMPTSERATRLVEALRARAFMPRLVYATAFNENDLDLLDVVLGVLAPGTAVIQHFMDYMPHDPAAFDARFLGCGAAIQDTWALTESLAAELSQRYDRDVEVVTALHQDVPAVWKTEHRRLGGETRAIILGNVWQPWVLPLIGRAWQQCRETLPALRPIDWYVHPARVQALLDAGYDLGDEIVWRGFRSGEALQARLREADLAILPFNGDAEAVNGYARFSLPSRLTELCGAGLPVVAVASDDTEPARFLRERGCGVSLAGADPEALAEGLLALLTDRDRRAALGARARAVAEQEFANEPFHTALVTRFVRLGRGWQAPAGWDGSARAEQLERLQGSERIVSARLEEVLCDRVHYACGRNVHPGWLNVDGFDASYPWGTVPEALGARIFRMDLTGPHPFPDDHFRLGYSEDFIEHIDQAAFVSFLAEAWRTFRPGGVLRLSTPGLPGILRRHLRGSDWQAAQVLLEEAYVRWMHKHFLTFDELQLIARQLGWREVRACTYGQSDIPELVLDSRPDQAELNLVVELVK